MIPKVTDAGTVLQLPNAKPSVEDVKEACEWIKKVDAAVTSPQMRFSGIGIQVDCVNNNAIAIVALFCKRAGYNPQWTPRVMQSAIKGGEPRLIGYNLILTPAESVYMAMLEELMNTTDVSIEPCGN